MVANLNQPIEKGQFGLQMLEGGRLTDAQLDTSRNAVRRMLKSEKSALLHMFAFPDRPISAKGNGTRMGKGKGAVDYFGTWVREGKVVMEISGARKELALKALNVASQMLPLKSRAIEQDVDMPVAPRVLPHFVLDRLARWVVVEYPRLNTNFPLQGRTGTAR